MNKLIVILGPTGSGKTKWAVRLAKSFDGEIVSADSRQIYKEMDIGTDKIQCPKIKSEESKKYYLYKGIPHHLIDIIAPDQEFTLAQYKKQAVKTVKDIHKRKKLPFLVGGTGLYIQSVIDNLNIPKVRPDPKIRKKLEEKNKEDLFQELQKTDPKAIKFIDPNNKRRIVRALEVYLITGKTFSQQRKKNKPLFETLQIGIDLDKEKLKKKINQRVEAMFKEGLIQELKKLLKKYNKNLPAMSGIGYAETIQYLEGKINLEEAKTEIQKNTWRYSRRQMSWFRRDSRIHWTDNYNKAKNLIKEFCRK